MSAVLDRFLRYVKISTVSDEGSRTMPSTPSQLTLARMLVEELSEIGVQNVYLSEEGYVYGEIPATREGTNAIALISHMDTVSAGSSRETTPRIISRYPGGPICLSADMEITPEETPALKDLVGQDLVVTDGNSVLGADDKAGVAEIVTAAEYLIQHPKIPHGRVAICFTPDEEIGRGTDAIDLARLGADFGYTVDGGPLGEIEFENTNAASAEIAIRGVATHPGGGKNIMVNALELACLFHSMLPAEQKPEYTEGYEGYYMLMGLSGNCEKAEMGYIIREHDKDKFQKRKELLRAIGDYVNLRYPGSTTVKIEDSYYNMAEKVRPHFHLIEDAQEAFRQTGVEPALVAIRGGTDGAQLSWKGLPCPNLSTGGYHFHSCKEFIPVAALEKMPQVLVRLLELNARREKSAVSSPSAPSA